MIRAHQTSRVEHGRSLPMLLWRFAGPTYVASTASAGGGLGPRWWIANASVRDDYGRHDLDGHLAELAAVLDLSGRGVGMLTAADVRKVRFAAVGGVTAEVTVGLTDPTWAADRAAVDVASDAAAVPAVAPPPGTINIVAQLPVRLTDAALCNALCTATEAKAQALADAGVSGTGTPSDAVTLTCPVNGPADTFGGPRSRWGAPLARAVHQAVLAGALAWQEQAS
ncbi:MAG TPA: adenosylcobinamide amidohydrolase [Jatrophihabitantaceae bacterium]|nr:adenosylcobinamide amidohydrolase [Jatrophihabitantaceae bacterium]